MIVLEIRLTAPSNLGLILQVKGEGILKQKAMSGLMQRSRTNEEGKEGTEDKCTCLT